MRRGWTTACLLVMLAGCGVDGVMDGSDEGSAGSLAEPGTPPQPDPSEPAVAPEAAGSRPGDPVDVEGPALPQDEREGQGYGVDPGAEQHDYDDDDEYDIVGYGDLNGCGVKHRMIGWVAELGEIAHDVSGTAVIVDACTVEIRDFHYDGRGGPTQIYGGRDGNWFGGFPMTELLSTDGYDGETLTAVLPMGLRLDDLDGISVWCIRDDADFGHGMFAPKQ